MSSPPRPRWQRVLHRRQAFADNHVDDSFLASLVTNANVQQREYWDTVRAAAVIVQQISVMTIFFVTLTHVNRGGVSVEVVAAVNGAAAAAVLLWMRLAGPQFFTRELLPDVPTMLAHVGVFAGALFIMAPILATLTQGYRDETIWAVATLLSATHLCFHDYGGGGGGASMLVGASALGRTAASHSSAGAFSFNAVILAAVLLASRLPSTTHVFICCAVAIEYFVLYPLLRNYIRVRSEAAHTCLTLIWSAATLALLAVTSRLLAVVYLAGALFITLVVPLWLLEAHVYKNEIRGPWDIAKVTRKD